MGLSQEEVAFLLGCSSAAHVSRYEHFSRVPTLQTAFALAVIFRASVRDLFAGEYEKIEKVVCRQAHHIATRLAAGNPDQATARKLTILRTILSSELNHS